MDWDLKVNNSWTGGQKKNLQRMLNTFGFTDGAGNTLKEDGVIGPKTTSAIQKLNRYQSEAKMPSSETRDLQKQLNGLGFKDGAGKSLKEDGVYGPKTDAVNNDFENNFLDGVTGGRNTAKTVQKGIYPSLPQITQKDVESVITPKAVTVKDPMASQKNPDGTWNLTPKILTNFRGPRTQVAAPGAWSGSGGTSANEQKLFDTAKAAQEITARIKAGRVQGGYQETGGAQGQAYQGNIPGSTYDKTKHGTYTPYTETGGAQGQATTAPGTGNEGMDMLLGKGKYTGVYNNLNRPSDTIILRKVLESANLPKSANIVYNGADQKKQGETMPAISDNIEDITKPRFVDGQFYAPFQKIVTLSGPANIFSEDAQKQLGEEKKKAEYQEAKKERAQIAIDELHERRRKESNENELENLKERYKTEDSINLENPENREALYVIQRLAGVDESNTISDDLIKVLQNYMLTGKIDFDFDDYSLTRDNFYTLLEVAQDVKNNPQINKNKAKAIEAGFNFAAAPEETAFMSLMEFLSYLASLIGKKDN